MNKQTLIGLIIAGYLLLACGTGDRHFAAVYADAANLDNTARAVAAWDQLNPNKFGLVIVADETQADVTIKQDLSDEAPAGVCAHTIWVERRPRTNEFTTELHARIVVPPTHPDGCEGMDTVLAHELGHYMSGTALHSEDNTDLMSTHRVAYPLGDSSITKNDVDFAYNEFKGTLIK